MVSQTDILNARILIVDDHECNTEVFEVMLSQAGYLHVSSTMNPPEVCALHRAKRFDLIIELLGRIHCMIEGRLRVANARIP